MSNYLAQIAARSTAPDQPMLTPVHSPVEAALNDPFDRVSFAAGETGHAAIPGPVQPVKERADDATALLQPVEIKPVYLSKYIERNHYHTRENTHQVVTKSQGRNEVVRTEVEHPVSPILPAGETARETTGKTAGESRQANKEKALPMTGSEKINPVQQKNRSNMELTPKQKSNGSKRPATIKERSTVILPVAVTTSNNKEPVLLQPHLPLPPHANPQKEKPVPALVIGKITVEIVPAQKPVNKIINHVIKPQPAASATAYRGKNSFGLGQL